MLVCLGVISLCTKREGGAFVLGQGANEEQNILHLTNA